MAKKTPPQKIVSNENPYLRGRREWNERYGDYIKQASTWRLIAIASSVISVVAVFGVIFIGSQSKITPYIIEVDKLGRSVTVGPSENINPNDERVVSANLADFVTNFRTIWGDTQTQRKLLLDAYKYIAPGSPAEKTISNYFRENDPFALSIKERRSVQIRSVIKIGNENWQIDWEEIRTTPTGAEISKEAFKALVQIKQIQPTAIEEIYKNPLGIYINEINFAKTI